MTAAKRVALAGVLMAAALAVSWLEAVLPPLLPLPGVKLGLANIVTLFALYRLSDRLALLIVVGRCALSALLFTGLTGFMFALAGGLLALLVMRASMGARAMSVYGVSMLGAAAHNVGQVLVAMGLMRSAGLYSYLLLLLPVAIPTGLLTALIYSLCLRNIVLEKSRGE